MKNLTIIFIFTVFFTNLFAKEKKEDVYDILDKVDKIYRAETSHAEMEMKITTPNWKRTMKLEVWSEGMEKTFISVLSPAKDKGVSTLRVDNDMWNYFPKVGRVMKVPPSMMMGSWMGSDFTNDDLVKQTTFREDYNAKIIQSKDKDTIVIEMTPKESAASVWGKIVATIRKRDYMPLKQEYFSEKGKKMRIMKFSEFKKMGGKVIPAVMEIIPLNKKGHSTKITYIKADFDIKLDSNIFSLRNLRKKR
ncbi:MAG: outer membrane lipoprotein-sorting protein [bacterium]